MTTEQYKTLLDFCSSPKSAKSIQDYAEKQFQVSKGEATFIAATFISRAYVAGYVTITSDLARVQKPEGVEVDIIDEYQPSIYDHL